MEVDDIELLKVEQVAGPAASSGSDFQRHVVSVHVRSDPAFPNELQGRHDLRVAPMGTVGSLRE